MKQVFVRRDVKINSSLDMASAHILDQIADREAEGNKSLALRQLLRAEGARRGLLVPASQDQPAREVQNASRA